MNTNDIVSTVRDMLGDTEPVYLWTDRELVSYTDRIVKELCKKAKIIVDSVTASICQVAVVAATKSYLVSPLILEIKSARLSSQSIPLKMKSVYFMRNYQQAWESDSDGTPIYYLTDVTTGYITLHPTPTSSDTLKLSVVRLPLVTLTTGNMGSELEIPLEYQDELYDGILSLAYTKQDRDTFNPGKATFHKQLWMQKLNDITANVMMNSSVDTNNYPLPDYIDMEGG